MALLLYTASSAVPLLIMLLVWGLHWGPMDLPTRLRAAGASRTRGLRGGAFLIAFLVKFPIYAVHSWLPKAHVEASAGGSMLLAGVLLKMGGFGLVWFVRFLPSAYCSALSA